MSLDDTVFADVHGSLFEAFGIDATVKRGAAAPVPVRIIVNRGQEELAEHGQYVQRVTVVDMQVAQWMPQEGDLVAWADRLGSHTRKVDKRLDDDGFVVRAVLHG